MISSVNSIRYRKKNRHRIQYACITGNYKWFKELFDVGNQNKISSIRTSSVYDEKNLFRLLDGEACRHSSLDDAKYYTYSSAPPGKLAKESLYYRILMNKGIRLRKIVHNRLEGQRKIFDLLMTKTSLDINETDKLGINLFRSVAMSGNYLLLKDILKYSSKLNFQQYFEHDLRFLFTIYSPKLFIASWTKTGLDIHNYHDHGMMNLSFNNVVLGPQVSKSYVRNQLRCIKLMCGISEVNLNETNYHGYNLLIWATRYGYLTIIDELYKHGDRVDVNFQENLCGTDSESETSTFEDTDDDWGDPGEMDRFYSFTSNLKHDNGDGGDDDDDNLVSSDESIYAFSDSDSDSSVSVTKIVSKTTKKNGGNSALHIACYGNNLDAVKRLLRFPNIDLSMRNNPGETPLDASKSNPRIFRILFSHAHFIEETTTTTFPLEKLHVILNRLCSGPKPDTYADLIQQMCRIPLVRAVFDDHYGTLPLPVSFPDDLKYCKYNPVVFQELFDLSKYINEWDMIDVQTDEWKTIFHLACATNSMDVVQQFIRDPRFDLNCTDSAGFTGLMRSAEKGHVEIVTELLKCAPVHVTNLNQGDKKWDRTALLLAVDNRRISVVQRLCEHLAVDLNRSDKKKYSPIGLALRRNFRMIADELLRYYPGRLITPYISIHENRNAIFKNALRNGYPDLLLYILDLLNTLPHFLTFLETNLDVFFNKILDKPNLIDLLYNYMQDSVIWNYPNKNNKTLLYVASETNNLLAVQRLCQTVTNLDCLFTNEIATEN